MLFLEVQMMQGRNAPNACIVPFLFYGISVVVDTPATLEAQYIYKKKYHEWIVGKGKDDLDRESPEPCC